MEGEIFTNNVNKNRPQLVGASTMNMKHHDAFWVHVSDGNVIPLATWTGQCGLFLARPRPTCIQAERADTRRVWNFRG